VILSP